MCPTSEPKEVTCPSCGSLAALLDHYNWITCDECDYQAENHGEVDHQVLPEEDWRDPDGDLPLPE